MVGWGNDVKYRPESVAKVTVSIKSVLSRFALVFLVVAAFSIMLLGKAETIVVERLRSTVVDAAAPILSALSQPLSTISSGIDSIGQFFSVYEENSRLRDQNARLMEWQSAALSLAAENSNFRKLLEFVPEREMAFATARVIGDSGGVFVRSVLINAGIANNISKGDAVINGQGLVGRVAETGRQSGRVLLITDLNSRIPVIAAKSRARAILAGDNRTEPKLEFLPAKASLKLGDKIVTSGHGGAFPAGLPVGRISIMRGGDLRVQPFADLGRLEYVRIITEYPSDVVNNMVPSPAKLLSSK